MAITTTTGLISGIDIAGIVDAMIAAERSSAVRLEARRANVQAVQTGLSQLQAQLLTLTTSTQTLSTRQTFTKLSVANSAPNQLTVETKGASTAGSYQFQAVRLATSHRAVSRGFGDATTQQIGTAGKLVISQEGRLDRSAKLELLNGAEGVRRGTIRITDRSGETADIDLSRALTVSDVVNSINQATIGVEARSVDGRLVLSDTTGATSGNLSVIDVAGGNAAKDLGIRKSVSSSTLMGEDVYQVTEDFSLSLINDGNQLRKRSGQPELAITLSDDTVLNVELSDVKTIGDVVNAINDHEGNDGKLTAALSDGRLVLTDNAAGAGELSVSNLNGSNAVEVFGLAGTAAGNVLTGGLLSGGSNTVLLRNLNGGQGIAELGELSLTDRTGETAIVDLSDAETLDDVLEAINSATSTGGERLQLQARLNDAGTGIEITDTSGATTGPLIIEDVGTGTVAADLGIAVNDDVSEQNSGSLKLRTINEATSLSTYAPNGKAVPAGSFQITDSDGNVAVINISSSVSTLGDVLDRINAATGIEVTARLNDTGDGIVLIDDAAGTGTLKVSEIGGSTAAGLRLLGQGTAGDNGQQQITSRRALVVDVAATDTLQGVMSKVNLVGGNVRASIINTGAAVNGAYLSLASTASGESGRFVVDDGGLGLGFATKDEGTDAVLRVGSDAASAFMMTSATNKFTNAIGFVDVTLLQASTTPANVDLKLDQDTVKTAVQSFIAAYNSYIDLSKALTAYDAGTETRSALQGTTAPLTIASRFQSLITSSVGPASNSIRTLADIGVTFTTGGKLKLDNDALTEALTATPDQVLTLFTDATNGFGVKFDDALEYFNDNDTGALTLQYEALQANADELTARIARIDERLLTRRAILENQFIRMETVLSGLQSQQTAISGLSTILENLKASNS